MIKGKRDEGVIKCGTERNNRGSCQDAASPPTSLLGPRASGQHQIIDLQREQFEGLDSKPILSCLENLNRNKRWSLIRQRTTLSAWTTYLNATVCWREGYYWLSSY